MDSKLTIELEQRVFKAKLAEQAERYDDMAECMKVVAQEKDKLTIEVSLFVTSIIAECC